MEVFKFNTLTSFMKNFKQPLGLKDEYNIFTFVKIIFTMSDTSIKLSSWQLLQLFLSFLIIFNNFYRHM